MLDYGKICALIYEEKSEEECEYALELLKDPQEGMDEILRYLYMKNAYFRLGEKEKIIECGKKEEECFIKYFEKKKVLTDNVLNIQYSAIKQELLKQGECDIIIDAHVSRSDVEMFIGLKKEEKTIEKNLLTDALQEETRKLFENKRQEEIYILCRAVVRELQKTVKEKIEENIYHEVILHVSRGV